MINIPREDFNASFTDKNYQLFLAELNSLYAQTPEFRIAETPVFIDVQLKEKLITACSEIIEVIKKKDFKSLTHKAIPNAFLVQNENQHPHFICLDFGICKDENGELNPQLIELQGFSSLFAWQYILGQKYPKYFAIPEGYTYLFSGLNPDTYLQLFKKTVLGSHEAKNVVLLDLKPKEQKTRVDFYATKELLGIEMVCISELIQKGRKLFYLNQGEEIEIKRIFNRLIFDDLQANPEINASANIFEDLEVEWVAHPNWFYRISKYTMPFLKNKFVPETCFLHEVSPIPSNLDEYVLKPLFSFSGQGVLIDVTEKDLLTIKDPENWILQKKVKYEEVVMTPEGGVKCEIRLMYLWPEGDENPTLAINLTRLSRGKMIGVRYNQDFNWVGGTIAFFEP